jgi:hypothetical protein
MRLGLILIGKNKNLISYQDIFKEQQALKGNSLEIVTANNPLSARFQYLIFFVDGEGFFKKAYEQKFLDLIKQNASAGTRYASIFINKTFLANRTLLRFMKIIEHEGFITHQAAVINSINEAQILAKELEPIEPGK